MKRPEDLVTDALLLPDSFLVRRAREIYERNPRHYHTFDHARAVLWEAVVVHFCDPWIRPKEVLVAALFHDAVYYAGAPDDDNEAMSAEVAREELECAGMESSLDIDHVMRLIHVTSEHFRKGAKFTEEEAKFLDCDIVGLAAPWVEFTKQNTRIDQEFMEASGKLWEGITTEKLYARRAAWLRRVLDLPYIFHSERGRKLYELSARDNIKRILEYRYEKP